MWPRQNYINSTGVLVFNPEQIVQKFAEKQVLILSKSSSPLTMVRVLTQSYITNGGSKIQLHKTQSQTPSANNIFNVHNTKRIKFLTRLQVGFSHLKEHKFWHSFQDAIDSLCRCTFFG